MSFVDIKDLQTFILGWPLLKMMKIMLSHAWRCRTKVMYELRGIMQAYYNEVRSNSYKEFFMAHTMKHLSPIFFIFEEMVFHVILAQLANKNGQVLQKTIFGRWLLLNFSCCEVGPNVCLPDGSPVSTRPCSGPVRQNHCFFFSEALYLGQLMAA